MFETYFKILLENACVRRLITYRARLPEAGTGSGIGLSIPLHFHTSPNSEEFTCFFQL